MYVCVECQVEMRCHKNEVGLDVGDGQVYSTDRFICPVCKKKILVVGRGQNSYSDPDHISQHEFLTLKKVDE
jgi:DNA-directed RNA polymerase subunit RPC12/RpoP